MARWAKDGRGSFLLGATVADAKEQEVKEHDQALPEQLGVTFLDAEASPFILVQGKKHKELGCAAPVNQHLGWAVPPALGGGDRTTPQSLLLVPLLLPSILPVTCRSQARGTLQPGLP